jgi:hypothetical protein
MNKAILVLLAKLEQAANHANPDMAEEVLWLEDERFTEIEDFIPGPIDSDGVRNIHGWIRENGKPGENVRFVDIQQYQLTPEVLYATAIQELNFDEPSKSRVSFIFLKKGEQWGIIHAHYSAMPTD